jgi:hypothetical protein
VEVEDASQHRGPPFGVRLVRQRRGPRVGVGEPARGERWRRDEPVWRVSWTTVSVSPSHAPSPGVYVGHEAAVTSGTISALTFAVPIQPSAARPVCSEAMNH